MPPARRPPCVVAATSGSTLSGVMKTLQKMVLEAYDRVVGLNLDDVAVDGCITKAPCGGERAGKSPVDRGKQVNKASNAR